MFGQSKSSRERCAKAAGRLREERARTCERGKKNVPKPPPMIVYLTLFGREPERSTAKGAFVAISEVSEGAPLSKDTRLRVFDQMPNMYRLALRIYILMVANTGTCLPIHLLLG